MFPALAIDKNSDTPAYRQLIEGITSLIRDGLLSPGDRLPSERELADRYGLARGTVKKAYEKLADSGVLDVTQGRGTFVSYRQDVISEGRKEQALACIRTLLAELEKLKFSPREISSLIDLELMEREERRQAFCIAVVDCNPEALYIFERQLARFSRVTVVKVLLDSLTAEAEPAARLEPFQMIVTTSTHYSELLGMLPALRERIVQMVVSPSQESIIQLAKIGVAHEVGILCESPGFLKLVRTRLRDFQVAPRRLHHLLLAREGGAAAFLSDKDVLIVPAHYPVSWTRDDMTALQAFRERGGRFIEFDYQIERGSLLHLEERIKEAMQRQA